MFPSADATKLSSLWVASYRCFCFHWEAAATLEAEGLRQALLKHLKRRRPTSKEWPRTISVALSFSISTQSARLACSPKGRAKAVKYWWPLLGSEWNALCFVPLGKFMCLRFFFFFWRQESWTGDLFVWSEWACNDAPVVDRTKIQSKMSRQTLLYILTQQCINLSEL